MIQFGFKALIKFQFHVQKLRKYIIQVTYMKGSLIYAYSLLVNGYLNMYCTIFILYYDALDLI